MKSHKVLIAAVWAMAALSGCGEAPYYYANKVIDPPQWHAGDPAVFTFDITDTDQAFDFLLQLRHGDDYPYSNLYLFMQLDFPNGKKSVDTLECILADPRGRWNGKRTGRLVDHRIMLNHRRMFPLEGTYHLRIRQAMRQDPLPEVHDVGFILQHTRVDG